jgi:hybrid cluster-associated redox disulfide protein
MNIQKDTPIKQIISSYPQTIKFFNDMQMSCSSCFAVSFDTLENGALMHNMDVNTLIVQLDQFIHSNPAKTTPISAETNSAK